MIKINTEHYKNKMSDEDVILIMSILGSNYNAIYKDFIIFNTICHNKYNEVVGKKKLYYYKNTKSFYCYTSCGFLGDIFDLVRHILNISFSDSLKFILSKLNISVSLEGNFKNDLDFEKKYCIENDFIKIFDKPKKNFIDKTNSPIDDSILRCFNKFYHHQWIEEFISIKTLEKFNILFDISNYRIIIPVYDENFNLIGIRCRNLTENDIDLFGKYTILSYGFKTYNYSKSCVLYGLCQNLESIKETKTVIIGESEKFVLQHGSFYESSNAVALCGSTIHDDQIKLLLKYNVENIVIALDKEYTNQKEANEFYKKIEKSFIKRLNFYFNVSVIFDSFGELDYKMSPTDKGKEVFESLYNKRYIF